MATIGRDSVCRALVLRYKPIGEQHASVTLLTDRYGLLHGIAHGAYSQRGRLRALTNRFCDGVLHTTRTTHEIRDFTAEHYYPALRENLRRYYTACLWGELLLATIISGNDGARLYRLLAAALEYLDQCPEGHITPASARFLWRYIELNGVRPDLNSCITCGRRLAEGEQRFYSRHSSGIFCANCADDHSRPLSADSVALLEGEQPLRHSSGAPAPAEQLPQQMGLLYALAQQIIERPLKTLRIAAGIL